ncbi:hypothetical protein BC936DRAFT_145330 [Jimgerdemannia flammicorona]|uniref:Uncharacterized protein n=1 Tax=Jimgerdemannia flammicorona TaxID=994334 RepID=A0A433DAF3_9FUNG|nr:hypothetical protein BC936DRAFT_145330 [Jimgerdemannia flammicorona]
MVPYSFANAGRRSVGIKAKTHIYFDCKFGGHVRKRCGGNITVVIVDVVLPSKSSYAARAA